MVWLDPVPNILGRVVSPRQPARATGIAIGKVFNHNF
jgi:hypothetical protein